MEHKTIVWEALDLWLSGVASEDLVGGVHDIHIDELNADFAERSTWLESALVCFDIAIAVRDAKGLPLTVALGIGLRSSALPSGLNFACWTDLDQELDDSPPSIYVWADGADPVGIQATKLARLRPDFPIPLQEPYRALLSEWYDDGDAEFRRTLWLENP